METPTFMLFEHAAGYTLFRVKEFEDIGNIAPEVEASVADVARFGGLVKLVAFSPFANPTHALENCNAVSEGIVHPYLLTFLETHVPREKKAKTKLGVAEPKLAGAISEALTYVQCISYGITSEIFRGIRMHFPKLCKDLTPETQGKAQLGLGHSYSRAKVKFNVHRVDNMIIQSIALLDQLDKDINTFAMRIREWYSYHFPELYKIVPEQYSYCRCAKLIRDRKSMSDALVPALTEILMDEQKVAEIFEAARTSMGMDISDLDLMNIERFTTRVVALAEFRIQLQGYLRDRMHSCAPSLSVLVGEQVGARLISHAGSLTSLAKYPASTIQILGAEKALFRALKTRGNTPKYGLLFHSSFIGRAQAKNKGRVSRYLANKCALASRIDCFSDMPVETFGEFLKQQVEDRLKYFETGEKPKKNVDVMHEAVIAAVDVQAKAAKKRKKRDKKDKRAKEAASAVVEQAAEEMMHDATDAQAGQKKKKKSKGEAAEQNVAALESAESPAKKRRKEAQVPEAEPVEEVQATKKKKQKKATQ